jgi:hypothetical protein
MLVALTKPRSPHFYRLLMFKLLVIVCLAGLFYSSTPARDVTADALSTASEFIRP